MHRVYLAGPISGDTFQHADDWRIRVSVPLQAAGYSIASPTARERHIFAGTTHAIQPTEVNAKFSRELVYRDDYDVRSSNIIFANFTATTDGRVSIGTVSELTEAWVLNKYCVVAMADKDVHDHPFVTARAHFRAYTEEEAVEYLVMLAKTHNG